MKEYLISIGSILIVSEVLLMLMPEGGAKRISKFASGLLVMIMLIIPVKQCDVSLDAVEEESNTSVTYSEIIMDVYNDLMINNN